MKTVVKTGEAPAAIGPYSQAIIANGLVFVSGQIPMDPVSNQLVEGDIGVQTARVLDNISAILAAAGSSLKQVLKVTVYLADMSVFSSMNEVYARYFSTDAPARATIQAARLPRDVAVEMDVIALAG
jgi:2-iminobutanoate/2-iminopropanoate deaminase